MAHTSRRDRLAAAPPARAASPARRVARRYSFSMQDVTLAVATRDRPELVRRFLVPPAPAAARRGLVGRFLGPLPAAAASQGWQVVVVDQSRDNATEELLDPLEGV